MRGEGYGESNKHGFVGLPGGNEDAEVLEEDRQFYSEDAGAVKDLDEVGPLGDVRREDGGGKGETEGDGMGWDGGRT